jgi:hypothetical protein
MMVEADADEGGFISSASTSSLCSTPLMREMSPPSRRTSTMPSGSSTPMPTAPPPPASSCVCSVMTYTEGYGSIIQKLLKQSNFGWPIQKLLEIDFF